MKSLIKTSMTIISVATLSILTACGGGGGGGDGSDNNSSADRSFDDSQVLLALATTQKSSSNTSSGLSISARDATSTTFIPNIKFDGQHATRWDPEKSGPIPVYYNSDASQAQISVIKASIDDIEYHMGMVGKLFTLKNASESAVNEAYYNSSSANRYKTRSVRFVQTVDNYGFGRGITPDAPSTQNTIGCNANTVLPTQGNPWFGWSYYGTINVGTPNEHQFDQYELNPAYEKFVSNDSAPTSSLDRTVVIRIDFNGNCPNRNLQSIVIHELGHVLGLYQHFDGFGAGTGCGNLAICPTPFYRVLNTLYRSPLGASLVNVTPQPAVVSQVSW
jgi:hypothetical protein